MSRKEKWIHSAPYGPAVRGAVFRLEHRHVGGFEPFLHVRDVPLGLPPRAALPLFVAHPLSRARSVSLTGRSRDLRQVAALVLYVVLRT